MYSPGFHFGIGLMSAGLLGVVATYMYARDGRFIGDDKYDSPGTTTMRIIALMFILVCVGPFGLFFGGIGLFARWAGLRAHK